MSTTTMGALALDSTPVAAPAAAAAIAATPVIPVTSSGVSAPGAVSLDARRLSPRRTLALALLAAAGLALLVVAIVQGITPLDVIRFLLWHSVEIVLGVALALAANGVVMWKKERHSLANLLPLLASGAIVGALVTAVVLLAIGQPWAYVVGLAGYLAISWVTLLFVCFLVYTWIYPRVAGMRHPDYAVVLGSGLVDGNVSPLLASRVRRGAAAVRRERARGHEAILILSGGQGADEPRSEAAAMAEYARLLGIPAEWIRTEERSRTTEQNLRFTREIVAAEPGLGPDARGLVVTSDYHVLRAGLIARSVGINAPALGAATARYFRPAALMREFVALVVRFRTAAIALTALVVLPLPMLYAVLLFA